MNIHSNHNILKIDDEEALKKENLTIDINDKNLDDEIQKLTNLKNTIENEVIKIDNRYEKVDTETTKSFELKRKKLNEEEKNLKEKLKTEVTKIKENLENFTSSINNLVKSCEKIKKGIKALNDEEKNMIQTLCYISKINKNKKEITILTNSSMKNLEINFNENKCIIEYDEYDFNKIEQKKEEKKEEPRYYGKKEDISFHLN